MTLEISEIESKVSELAKIIGAPENLLPTFDFSEHSGRPHVEVDSSGYHFVVAERGQENHRHTTFDVEEILYDVFQVVTFELACKYELNNRINWQDSRRIMFQHQEELLSRLSSKWSERRKQEHDQILQKHPFNDVYDVRSAYATELKEQGIPPEIRWKMVSEKYPPLKKDLDV